MSQQNFHRKMAEVAWSVYTWEKIRRYSVVDMIIVIKSINTIATGIDRM